uniref:Uncharacterized protein n=1 Tax=Clytia hemisphaerica TaxID=252671 RepID=A0A7M5WUL1_9CNID
MASQNDDNNLTPRKSKPSAIEVKNGCIYVGGKRTTNWSPRIIGAVCDEGDTIEGYIFEHPPSTVTDPAKKKRWRSYLTNENLSSSWGIMNNLEYREYLKTIQTIKNTADKYLTEYFDHLTEQYDNSPECIKLIKLKWQGKQTNGSFGYWTEKRGTKVVRFFKKVGNEVVEIDEEQSGFVVIGEFNRSLVLSENLNGSFKSLVEVVQKSSGSNFPAAVQIFGAAFMALNFSSIMKTFGFVPMPIVIGPTGTTKSTITKLVMRSVGVTSNIYDPTYASMAELVASAPIPLLWEDAENFSVLGEMAMLVYNNSQRSKCDKGAVQAGPPLTMPVSTTNGCFLKKVTDPVFHERFISRVVLVPFIRTNTERLSVITKLKFALDVTQKSSDVASCFTQYIGLEDCIGPGIITDPLMKKINTILKEEEKSLFKQGDPRSDQNY